jgi:peptide/nickel transport system substrate-binding protein
MYLTNGQPACKCCNRRGLKSTAMHSNTALTCGVTKLSSTKKFSKPAIAVLLIAIIVVIAGASYYFTSRPGPSTSTSASAAAPTTLVVDKANELQSVDPGFDYEYAGWEILQNVYQTLVWYNGTGTTSFKGVLAESWTSSSDGMVYTFKLRQNVKFSNGDPFDASAVKYSFDRVLRMNQPPSWILTQDMNLNSVKVLDPYTVEIHLTQPYAAFLATMATVTASIVDPKVVDAHGGVVANSTNAWMDSNAVGTSPFYLSEWVKGDHLTLAKNPYYWGTPVALEKVIVYYKTSVQTRLLDLKSGTAQMAVVDVNHVPDVNGTQGIIVQTLGLTYHIDNIYFNEKKSPFDIKKVRQAAAHAINYDAIRFGINHGLTEPYVGPMAKGLEGYDDSLQPYTYDPALAKQLLAEAGFPDGKGLPSITYLYYSRDASVALIAQEVQQDLSNIGMDVNLLGVSFSTYINTILSNPTDPKVPEMGWTEWYADYASPDDYVIPFANPQFPPIGWNPSYYSNPTVTDLMNKAPYELDAAKRTAMYHQITQIMYDDAAYVWLGQFEGYYVFRDNVHGLYNNPILAGYDFSTIYLTAP